MCGRYVSPDQAAIERAWHIGRQNVRNPFEPHFNAAPTVIAPIIRRDKESGGLELLGARWGLIPSWAKDKRIGAKLINARAETLAEKPAFRAAFQRRRCFVPMRGFYEWKRTPGGGKTPHYIRLLNEEVFAVAGLWEWWKSPEGEEAETYTVITTDANARLAELHDRMPVILARGDEAAWLDPDNKHPAELLKPYPADEMAYYAVSVRVNNARNEGADLIAPVAVK
jgi:putative SOS response-associated peptidase YedK